MVTDINVSIENATPINVTLTSGSAAGSLATLSDVSIPSPSNNEVLTYIAANNQWEAAVASATVATLNNIGDVTITSATSGDTILWNGSAWVNQALVATDIGDFDTEVSNNTTVTSFKNRSINFAIDNIVATDSISVGMLDNLNATITEVRAYTLPSSTTATFQLEERGETTPNTTGTDIMTAELVADDNQQSTTSFTNAAITAKNKIQLVASAITGTPTQLVVEIDYTTA